MRIAFVVTRADPIGGAQIHVRDLAAAARKQGHTVLVLAGGGGPFVDQLLAQDTPTIVLRHLTVPVAPIRDVRAMRELHAVLTEWRPDLITTHSAKAGTLGRLVGRRLRVPVIFTAHGWTFTPGFPGWQAVLYRRVERVMAPLARRIITVSEYDRRLALEAGVGTADRVITVHNGMPDVPPRLRAEPARTPPRLVMVARFGPQKDHATLLRALAGLQDQPWELDLIGEGPLIGETAALAGSLGIGARVKILGQRMDVDQLLAGAQASLLVTNYEGFPLSILEAMRSGLPVVASDVNGVAEAVRDGETGYLVPRGDVERLRDRIDRLLRAPALRAQLGAQGRARYEQHFTLTQCVAKTFAVYREVLAEGKAFEPTAADFPSAKTG